MNDEWKTLGMLFGAGLITGIGQLLSSDEPLNWRVITGRAISSGALGVAAGVSLAWIPGMPLGALVGLSCVLASLGTSGLEKLVQRITK